MSISKDLDKDTLREIIAGAKTSLEQMLAMALLKAEEELERLRAQEPVALTREDELSDLVKIGFSYIFPTGTEGVIHKPVKLYAEPKPLAVPDGWVLVPKEPTQAMINAWLSEVADFRGHAAGYRAMLEVVPAAPTMK